MTMNKEIFYWQSDKSWYRFDEEQKIIVLTDEAPERARKSFELMKEKSRTGAL